MPMNCYRCNAWPCTCGDGCTIIHGDCREVLPRLGSAIDLVLTDPPYNVGVNYGGTVDDRKEDYRAWCQEWFTECLRLAPVVALTPGIINVALWQSIKPTSWILCWHKPAAMGRSPVGFNNWEPVLLWGKPRNTKGNDVFIAPIVPDRALDGHPCPKPLRWAYGILRNAAPEAKAVLDPFAGTGTTLRAAKDCGIKAIGIEIEERYCEIAAKRLAQGVFNWDEANAE
jgi:site-specific DNA-methyltransferase (adenine-specific)